MCKRNTGDPLVRMFLDRYKVNLLEIPRGGAQCGDVYIRDGKRVSSAVSIVELMDPQPMLPPAVCAEPLADLSGSLSGGVSLTLGLGLLEGFLAAVGAAAIVRKLSAGYEQSRSTRLRFRFADATRDSIDPGSLGSALEGRRFKPSQPLIRPGNEYFVAAAVVRSPAIAVVAEDDRERRVDMDVEALAVAEVHAAVSVQRGSEGEVVFRGERPLAIGLELYELRHDDRDDRLLMLPQHPGDPVKAGRAAAPSPAFLAPDDEALLQVSG